MSKVIILNSDQYNEYIIDQMVTQIFNQICDNLQSSIRNIVIKPNMMYYWDASTGETTDPIIVSSIIDNLRRILGEDVNIYVVESDASAMETKYAFKILGYNELCKNKGVKLVNLSDGETITKKVKLDNGLINIKLNKLLLSADFVINVPKLKIHREPPVISCALKNFFGLISTRFKYQYHPKLSMYVSAINKIIKSNLIIVDGLIVNGKYPKKIGLLIGANDPVSCDIIASKIVGRNPMKDSIIINAIKEGIGKVDFQFLDPDSIYDTMKNKIPQLNSIMTNISWFMQLKLLKMYVRIIGDILPPLLVE